MLFELRLFWNQLMNCQENYRRSHSTQLFSTSIAYIYEWAVLLAPSLSTLVEHLRHAQGLLAPSLSTFVEHLRHAQGLLAPSLSTFVEHLRHAQGLLAPSLSTFVEHLRHAQGLLACTFIEHLRWAPTTCTRLACNFIEHLRWALTTCTRFACTFIEHLCWAPTTCTRFACFQYKYGKITFMHRFACTLKSACKRFAWFLSCPKESRAVKFEAGEYVQAVVMYCWCCCLLRSLQFPWTAKDTFDTVSTGGHWHLLLPSLYAFPFSRGNISARTHRGPQGRQPLCHSAIVPLRSKGADFTECFGQFFCCNSYDCVCTPLHLHHIGVHKAGNVSPGAIVRGGSRSCKTSWHHLMMKFKICVYTLLHHTGVYKAGNVAPGAIVLGGSGGCCDVLSRFGTQLACVFPGSTED